MWLHVHVDRLLQILQLQELFFLKIKFSKVFDTLSLVVSIRGLDSPKLESVTIPTSLPVSDIDFFPISLIAALRLTLLKDVLQMKIDNPLTLELLLLTTPFRQLELLVQKNIHQMFVIIFFLSSDFLIVCDG